MKKLVCSSQIWVYVLKYKNANLLLIREILNSKFDKMIKEDDEIRLSL